MGFDCLACTACCLFLEVRVLPTDDVPPEMRRPTTSGAVMLRAPDGACIALERSTGKCRIYDRRPQACRDFRVGGAGCLDAIAWLEGRRDRPRGQ